MEYLEGETLRERIRSRGQLGAATVLRLARQIASALAAAHAKHIVHRDLKPSNIMIVSDPDMVGGERIKVLDFGIAKLTNNQAKGQANTRTGMILGSPGYMSPEQCRNVSTVDERSDIYSLGVILYEMIAGKPPFVAESDAETMALHLYAEAAPLSQHEPNVKPDLAAFIHRMLHKQPLERPSTAELLRFLNTQSGFLPTTSMPNPVIKPVPFSISTGEVETLANTLSRASGQGRPIRRQFPRAAIAAGVIGAVVACLGGGVLLMQSRSHPDPTAVSAAPRMVRWVLTSSPNGAEVVRESDHQILGRTPFSSEQLAREGSESLIVRHVGYADQAVQIERGASRELSVVLSKVELPPAVPSTSSSSDPSGAGDDKDATKLKSGPGPGANSGKLQGKRRPSTKVTNADIELIK